MKKKRQRNSVRDETGAGVVDFTIGFRSRQCTFITASSSATRGRRWKRALVHGQFRKIPAPPFYKSAGRPVCFGRGSSRARLPAVRSPVLVSPLARWSNGPSVGRCPNTKQREGHGPDDGSASTRTYQPAAGGTDSQRRSGVSAPDCRTFVCRRTEKVQKLRGNPPPFL